MVLHVSLSRTLTLSVTFLVAVSGSTYDGKRVEYDNDQVGML